MMFVYHTAALHFAEKFIAKGKTVILDRHWPSEMVYGKVFRNGSRWPLEGRMMDRVILKMAGTYIFTLGDPEAIAKRHAQLQCVRREEYSHSISQVATEYNNLFYGFPHKVAKDHAEFIASTGGFIHRKDAFAYRMEIEGQDVCGFVEALINKAGKYTAVQYQPALQSRFRNVLGHIESARFLIVGDEANPKMNHIFWPFHDYGHSSLFLARTLHNINFREEDAMWTNVNHSDHADAHIRAILEMKPLRVVALGKNAEAGLKKIGVNDFVTVRHPQAAMRFSSLSDVSYKDELSRALF